MGCGYPANRVLRCSEEKQGERGHDTNEYWIVWLSTGIYIDREHVGTATSARGLRNPAARVVSFGNGSRENRSANRRHKNCPAFFGIAICIKTLEEGPALHRADDTCRVAANSGAR